MTLAVFHKLLALILTAAFGFVAARAGWLGPDRAQVARVLGHVAFTIFVPALLFRTTARLDFATLPWRSLAAFFLPVLAVLLAVYAVARARTAVAGAAGAATAAAPAAPAVRAIAASFGNSVQVGLPLAAALFGETGLALHIALVSLHALVLLSVGTALAELDLARGRDDGSLARTLAQTARQTVIHPVILPVLAGAAWNLAGLGLHPVVDAALAALAAAVVPLCLVLIGLSLAAHGVREHLPAALRLAGLKLVLQPALVLAVAHWGFGLAGLPLAVLVMMAALPVGSNALLLAQRYRVIEGEITAAIALSTMAFAGTAVAWLGVLAVVG